MKQNVDLLKSLMADDNDDDEVEKDNNSDKEKEKVPCDVGLRTVKIPQRQKICQISVEIPPSNFRNYAE